MRGGPAALRLCPQLGASLQSATDVRDAWTALLRSIQSNLSIRAYELATLAAARALGSSYCCLAHGSVLADKVFDAATVSAIMRDESEGTLAPRERA